MCFHSEILTTTVVCLFIAAVGFALIMVLAMPKRRPALVPISVNYHLTRVCNYNCKFCFHTNTTRYVCTLEDAKRGMKLLLEKGTKKINFSGGEPQRCGRLTTLSWGIMDRSLSPPSHSAPASRL